jgi:glycogen synthase
MKILHMLPSFYPEIGGIESFALDLVQASQALGHENCVVTSHTFASTPDLITVNGIPIHRVPLMTGLTDHNPAQLLHAIRRTTRVMDAFMPDLLHLHLGGPVAFLYLTVKKADGVPMVVTVYDLLQPGQDSPSVRKVLEKAASIAAISNIRHEECRAFAPKAAGRMKLIYASRPILKTSVSCKSAPFPLILMVGRLVREKGFDLALDAFAQIAGRFPDARMMLVGDGPMHKELAAQIGQLGLQNRVTLAGWVTHEALVSLYQRAWVTLVPSRHSESFGLVALEAMQAACPVIASRIGGLPEVVLDDETGLLIPIDDSESLAEAMDQLLKKPDWAKSLGQAGQTRAREVFGWETCVRAYETLYKESLRSWRTES